MKGVTLKGMRAFILFVNGQRKNLKAKWQNNNYLNFSHFLWPLDVTSITADSVQTHSATSQHKVALFLRGEFAPLTAFLFITLTLGVAPPLLYKNPLLTICVQRKK